MRAIPILILGVAFAVSPTARGQTGSQPPQPPTPLPQPTTKPAEQPKLSGEWVVTGGEREGQKLPAERIEGLRVVITADSITLTDRDQKPVFVARYALNTAKTPNEINMEFIAGPNKGQLAHGIVKSNDPNEMQLCYSPGQQGRPSDFRTTPGGSAESLYILRRGPVAPAPAATAPSQPAPPAAGAVVVGVGGVAGVVGVFSAIAPSTTWSVIAAESNGKPLPADQLRGAKVVISGNTVVVMREGQPPMVVRCALDTTPTPTHLNMTVVEGPHKGQSAPGIVEMVGTDRLRICYAANTPDRPREFRTQPGGAQEFLFTLQRDLAPSDNAGQRGSGQGNPGASPPNRGGPPTQNPPGRSGGGGG